MFTWPDTNTRRSVGELESLCVNLSRTQTFKFSQTPSNVCIRLCKHGTCFIFLKIHVDLHLQACNILRPTRGVVCLNLFPNTFHAMPVSYTDSFFPQRMSCSFNLHFPSFSVCLPTYKGATRH